MELPLLHNVGGNTFSGWHLFGAPGFGGHAVAVRERYRGGRACVAHDLHNLRDSRTRLVTGSGKHFWAAGLCGAPTGGELSSLRTSHALGGRDKFSRIRFDSFAPGN